MALVEYLQKIPGLNVETNFNNELIIIPQKQKERTKYKCSYCVYETLCKQDFLKHGNTKKHYNNYLNSSKIIKDRLNICTICNN